MEQVFKPMKSGLEPILFLYACTFPLFLSLDTVVFVSHSSLYGGYPVHCKIFSGIFGLYLLNTSSTTSLPGVKTRIIPKCCQMFSGAQHCPIIEPSASILMLESTYLKS